MATTPIYGMTDLWNDSGRVFNSIRMAITDTTSDISSRMVTLSTSRGCSFTIDKLGCVNCVTLGRGAGSVQGNIAIGYQALSSNTTGICKIAIGYKALTGSATSDRHIAIGAHATAEGDTSSGIYTNVDVIGSRAAQFGTTTCSVIFGDEASRDYNACESLVVGFRAGWCNNSSLRRSTFVGQEAGAIDPNTGAHGCKTAIGYQSMSNMEGNAYSTAIGYRSQRLIYLNTDAGSNRPANNTSIGTLSLWDLGSCSCNNTAIGTFSQYESFGSAATGSCGDNTSIGYATLFCPGVGSGYNTAIGCRTGGCIASGCYNTFLGSCSAYYNTDGSFNVGIGDRSLTANTIGDYNIAIGKWGLYSNVTGKYNIAIGIEAVNGSNNDHSIGIGTCSLYQSIGIENLAIGHGALSANTSGDYHVSIGSRSMSKNSVGDCSVLVGYQSGVNITNGSCHTGLGYCSLSSITSAFNTIGIGWCASPDSTNHHTVWGNSSNNVCNCVYASWSNVSDKRDKTDITSLDSRYGIEFIQRLNPVKYRWDHRETYQRECGCVYGEKDGTLKSEKLHYGFIAQDVKKAIGDLGIDFDGLGYDESKDAYRLTYEELLAPIVKTIKELIDKNKKLKQELHVMLGGLD